MSDEEERMSTGEEGEESEEEVEEGEDEDGEDEEVEDGEDEDEEGGDDMEEDEPAPAPKGPKLPPGAVGYGMVMPAPGSVALRKVERPEKKDPPPTTETEFGKLSLRKTAGPTSRQGVAQGGEEGTPEFAKVKLRKTTVSDVSQEISVISSDAVDGSNNNNGTTDAPEAKPQSPPEEESREDDKPAKEGKGKSAKSSEGKEREAGKGCCILM
jgi:hypothetical protein